MALVIAGRVVPIDAADPDAQFKGRVYVDDQGLIEAVTPAGAAPPTGYASAPVLNVGDGFVLPGLIDLHNHIGYNTLPLWAEPRQTTPFAHHDSWTRAPSYRSSVSWPANALVQAAPEAVLAYVQLRALRRDDGHTGMADGQSRARAGASQHRQRDGGYARSESRLHLGVDEEVARAG